jgi:hypothetical protein
MFERRRERSQKKGIILLGKNRRNVSEKKRRL